MHPNKSINIGITGNIGSGKSSFCAFIQEMGYPVYSADKIANSLLPAVKDVLVSRWGNLIWDDEGPNRKIIAKIVFNNSQELEFLNNTLHPLVIQEIDSIIKKAISGFNFFEIPLLFEAKLQDRFDYLILVSSSTEIVKERLMKRNPEDSENQLMRLAKQIPDSQKAELVDFVIENNDSLADLRTAAIELIKNLSDI